MLTRRSALVTCVHSGLVTSITLYARTGDVRALTIFFACNLCLAPLGSYMMRYLISFTLRPCWEHSTPRAATISSGVCPSWKAEKAAGGINGWAIWPTSATEMMTPIMPARKGNAYA